MKNLILLFSLLFFNPNPVMEGVWQAENNKEQILILYQHENNVQFYNYYMDQPFHILESPVSVENTHIHTTYQDYVNNEWTEFTYTLKNENTLLRECENTYTLTNFKRLK